MKYLFLSLWYKPEPVFKPHDFARELVARGHDVTVITGFPNYPAGRVYPGYRLRLWQSELIDGVQVIRIPHLIDRSQSALRRTLSYLSYSFVATLVGIIKIHKPEMIWTYQIGLPGIMLGGVKKAPLVHEVQDLWPEWGQTMPKGVRRWLYALLGLQERHIYRRAAVVVTISEGFRKALLAKGAPSQRISVLANWASDNNFYPAEPDASLAKKEHLGERFCVMYVGNVGAAQALDVVVEAAVLLHDTPEIEFVIIGDGVARQSLEDQVRNRGLTNIRFLGSRPQEQAAAYLAWADAALIHLKQNPVFEITIPSKTYAYLAVGKPILAAVAGDTARLIAESGAGVVCPPGDPQALAQAVRQLFALSQSERAAMGQAGRETFLSNYTRQALVDRYENLFRQVDECTGSA